MKDQLALEKWINVVIVCNNLCRQVTESKSGNYLQVNTNPLEIRTILRSTKTILWKHLEKWWATTINIDDLITSTNQPSKIAIILTYKRINTLWRERSLSFPFPD